MQLCQLPVGCWAPLPALAQFAYNAAVHSSTDRTLFEIVYYEVPRSDILTLDEVQKYSITRGSFVEGESLIGIIYANCEEATKSLTRTQAYQACTYNKYLCDL